MSRSNKIGYLCRCFRNKEKLTLKEISDTSDYSVQVLSAFEHGKSSNMFILIAYYNVLSDDNKYLFIEGLRQIFNRG